MSIVRSRPLLFISSAIVGLEDIRKELHSALEARDLVDDWVFELHATAGPEPASAQYLDVALRCDIQLVIVGDTRSQATEDEYTQAYADNPDKIIPIYLGDGSDEVTSFRQLLDDRHSRHKARDSSELLDLAVAAVERVVMEGRLVAGLLRESFEARLKALDRLLDLDPAQSYLPRLRSGGEVLAPDLLLRTSHHVVVTGIGGAGKTYGALVALHRLSRIRREADQSGDGAPASAIPLYLRATADSHTIADLLPAAFNAARFFPGSDLTSQYARDGRLALVVDGYDDLPAVARTTLVRAVEAWTQAHPRCRLMFLARTLPEHALAGFEPAEPAPLETAQLIELFGANGQVLRGDIDVPPEVADLIVRPFWAGALARFGLDVGSGLELIGRVVERRLDLASDGEPSEAIRVREALGALALSARPAVGVAVDSALGILSAWQNSSETAARFKPIAADALLDRVRGTGLVEPTSSDLVFVHPLVAARLAAEAVVRRPGLVEAVSGDQELAAFAAALATPEQEPALIELFASRDVFFLARVLRLAYPRARTSDLPVDLERYETALHRLSLLAGPEVRAELDQSRVVAATDGSWLAVACTTHSVSGIQSDFADVQALAEEGEIVMWRSSPFTESSPEIVAAAEMLLRFKRVLSRHTKTDMGSHNPKSLPKGAALDEAILARAYAVADEERRLREISGIVDTTLPTLHGHPHLVATVDDWGRDLDETWGHSEPAVSIERYVGQGYDGVTRFLAGESAEEARARLRRRVESELGSALNSGAWNKPAALAGWVW